MLRAVSNYHKLEKLGHGIAAVVKAEWEHETECVAEKDIDRTVAVIETFIDVLDRAVFGDEEPTGCCEDAGSDFESSELWFFIQFLFTQAENTGEYRFVKSCTYDWFHRRKTAASEKEPK